MARPKIAIVGVSALFPGSLDATGFWRDILAGTDLITDVPETHWLIEDYYDPDQTQPDKVYAHKGGFLEHVDFDAMGWGVPPALVPVTDTSQLLALIVAQRVLADAARGASGELDRDRMSVILGVTSAQELLGSMVSRLQRPVWQRALRQSGLPEDEVQAVCDRISSHYVDWGEANFPGLLGNVVAGRIANRLDLGGTNCVIDAACASTFGALAMAINELHMGDSDVVITGGVDTMNDIFMYHCFSKTPALSPTGDVRPFSDQADGTLLGEGLGMVALKRLEDAVAAGDRIYGVIAGVGSSSDGRSKSVYAPRPEGQAKAIRRAYDRAGWAPDTVELIEAHGTGTKAGDAAEFSGLKMAFEGSTRAPGWCALGSVKSQVGHAKAAAGAAGLFKAIMAVHHRVLPPTVKVDRPNPGMGIDGSPFHVNTLARPWVRGGDHARRAGVSSFGFGGSNFHVAVEAWEGEGRADRLDSRSHHVVLASADDTAGLLARARTLATEAADAGDLAWMARSSQQRFSASAGTRLAVAASSIDELIARLDQAVERVEKTGKSFSLSAGVHVALEPAVGEVGFVFPGQGSQYVGMGAASAMGFEACISAWDRAADSAAFGDEALADVVFPRPVFSASERTEQDARLTATEWAQPAIGVASLALLDLLRGLGVAPVAVAGHSYGELTALHCAGVLSEEHFLAASRRRGELMADAAKLPGAMTAVAADVDKLRELLAAWESPVVVANHNHPTQVVLSGETDAVAEVERKLDAEGLMAKRLTVATAFHSPVVADAAAPYADFLSGLRFSKASLPVYGNATAAPYPKAAAAARKQLGQQIVSPVRFVEQVEAMYAAGVRTFVEVGPGSVLSGLVGRILKGREHRAIALDRKNATDLAPLMSGLARLAVAGVALEWDTLWAEYREPVDPRTVAAPKLALPINGANYGKPYPVPGVEQPAPNGPRTPQLVETIVEVEKIVEVPVAVPTAAPSVLAAPAQDPGWMAAWQEAQRQTAEAHSVYQSTMAESHQAFLKAAETGLMALAAQLGGQPLPAVPVTAPTPAAVPVAPVVPTPVVAAPVPAPVAAVVAPPVQAAVVAVSDVVAPVVAAAAPASAGLDLNALLLDVVAEKTGYPADMLTLEMDLEGDLGIDSIKRVEILSTVRERAPELPEVDAAAMATLRTLGQVLDFLAASAPGLLPSTAAAAVPVGLDLNALLLDVVAEKTGYPAEMLTLEMDLEGDLGIDSIKRVEILSTVRERAPELPEVDAAAMATLRTLGQVLDFLAASAPGLMATATAPTAVPAGLDLNALLLDVVAEKTGYPAEMLTLDMDLEGDLGIDSIKRVEILSTVRERAPELPEVDAAAMATLRTLGQVLDFLAASAPGLMATATAPTAVPAGLDLNALLLDVVAEKTGYPAEMLTLDMDLEGDLGIDSIKRVEILSTVRERHPELPEVDAAAMATLRTLGQVLAFLQDSHGGPHTPPPARAEVPPAAELGRFALRAVPAPAAGMAPSMPTGVVAVTDEGSGLGKAVVRKLLEGGLDARLVVDVPADAAGLVLLDGLRTLNHPQDGDAASRSAFVAARTAARRLVDGGWLVTVQDTGGAFGLRDLPAERAWVGGLAALARTAAQEWPKATVKAIDLQRGGRDVAQLADVLVSEILGGGPEREVGLRADGERLALRSERVEVAPGVHTLGKDDVVVVSGGARGVTAATMIALGKATGARFVLLGRTALGDEPVEAASAPDDAGLKRALLDAARARGEQVKPAELGAQVRRILSWREIRGTLASLAAVGSDARYVSVDVTDTPKLEAALSEVRADWGPVTAIVHGAGVLADRWIAEKTDEQFDRVYDTKVGGLRAMLDATASHPLKAIVLFSSVAARCGNVGQVDYAMANEVLNKVAQAEAARRTDCVVRSLGWGPWRGGMVDAALEARFEALGVALIPLADGARMLVDELSDTASSEVELVLGGEPRGEALLADGTGRALELEVTVDRRSHPWLEGHAIQGVPVVPVVLVAEWFARAARSWDPAQQVVGLSGLRVLRGIRLEHFENGGDRFRVTASAVDEHRLRLELHDAKGQPRYAAEAELGRRVSPPTGAPEVTLEDWVGPVYGDVLFHGQTFQVIKELDGISPDGISGQLKGVEEAGWAEEPWATDVAAMDGGLQLALLWAKEVLGGPSLPTSIERLTTWTDRPVTGQVRCVLKGRTHAGSKAVSDLIFLDDEGRTVAELAGVETHLLPQA